MHVPFNHARTIRAYSPTENVLPKGGGKKHSTSRDLQRRSTTLKLTLEGTNDFSSFFLFSFKYFRLLAEHVDLTPCEVLWSPHGVRRYGRRKLVRKVVTCTRDLHKCGTKLESLSLPTCTNADRDTSAKKTNRQTPEPNDKTGRQTSRQTNRQADKQEQHTDTDTHGHRHRQQTDKQTNQQTNTHTHTHRHRQTRT